MASLTWRKSSHSTEGTTAQCVEVAHLPDGIGVRDSTNPHHGHLTVTPDELARLIQRIKQDV
ncbi:hypothetical protein Acsp03_53630 [Actinomadura sp. NBRC 104412]|uniref:DUF397 domain-containing protein n=1 Tax=Actinomadura sp. NBRC 104412 TaxID=3032203 RepID=UPI0024A46541|nr:DUF397 domain-containing protein [Actinomadura sp. NBRC 104412]GLZ07897.1 hypothetical protein Acsp03_53630 [Actinomadura sp. NBRC 104412]